MQKPPDHAHQIQRARHSLLGLAIGDAVGEMLAYRHLDAPRLIREGLAAGPWFHTDDTEMALSVTEILDHYGRIQQDALSFRFVQRFRQDPDRGYGKMTRIQMRQILAGTDWRVAATEAFSGSGSMGNGGAMRVAPLGAYFADDFERVVEEARLSSLVTHTHPEGVAGTIAVALAAAAAWQFREMEPGIRAAHLFNAVLQFTPESETRRHLFRASEEPSSLPVDLLRNRSPGDPALQKSGDKQRAWKWKNRSVS